MVGRLVEEEQIGLHDQQAGEVGPHNPATAEFLGLSLKVLLLVTEADKDPLCLGLDLGVAEGRVLGGGLGVLGSIDCPRLLQLPELLLQRGDIPCTARGNVENGLLSSSLTLLGEVADHGPLISLDRPGVGFVLLEKEREESRLSRAIGADQGDTFPVVDLHVGFLEEGSATDGFLEFADA